MLITSAACLSTTHNDPTTKLLGIEHKSHETYEFFRSYFMGNMGPAAKMYVSSPFLSAHDVVDGRTDGRTNELYSCCIDRGPAAR